MVLPLLPLVLAALAAQAEPPDVDPASADLLARVRALEERAAGEGVAPATGAVDLSGDRYGSIGEAEGAPGADHVLARSWYENVRVSGFLAAGYLETGDAGTKPAGGFEVRQAHVVLEAEAWEDASVLLELRPVPHGRDDDPDDLTGEAHVHFRRLAGDGVGSDLGVKLGRFDIPFGEEYLWQDQTDNPLITPSAPFPYGFDEGVLAYGRRGGLHWIGAVMDGSKSRSVDPVDGLAFAAKVHGRPLERLHLSASGILIPDVTVSAFQFGGSYIYPVGWMMPSTLGASASETVESRFAQVDAVWEPFEGARVSAFAGTGKVDDEDDSFDRDLEWLMVEPLVHLTEDVYAVLRYSTIRVPDPGEGYGLDGKFVSAGKDDFGYDVRSLERFSAGLGWKPNPHTLVKLEVGRDRFDPIPASPFAAENAEREFFGFQVVLSF